jgi:hypothetical protein
MNRFSADQPVEYEQAHRKIGDEFNEAFSFNGYYSEHAKWHGDQGDQDEGQRNPTEGYIGQVAGQNDDSDIEDGDENEEDNEKIDSEVDRDQLKKYEYYLDEREQQPNFTRKGSR